MNSESIIIAQPQRQSTVQRTLYAGLTAFAWFAWIYLWLPLLTLVAWFAGFGVARDELLRDDPQHGLDDLRLLLTLLLTCIVALLAWAAYNRARFRNTDRRRHVRDTGPDAISRHFDANDVISRRLRRSRRTVLHLDAHGRPTRAVIDLPHRLPGQASVVAGQIARE